MDAETIAWPLAIKSEEAENGEQNYHKQKLYLSDVVHAKPPSSGAENAVKTRGHRVSILLPQIPILPKSTRGGHLFFTKKQNFYRNFISATDSMNGAK